MLCNKIHSTRKSVNKVIVQLLLQFFSPTRRYQQLLHFGLGYYIQICTLSSLLLVIKRFLLRRQLRRSPCRKSAIPSWNEEGYDKYYFTTVICTRPKINIRLQKQEASKAYSNWKKDISRFIS